MPQDIMVAGDFAGIVPVGFRDLNSDDGVPHARPGTYGFMVDSFGIRLFRYGQNRSGAAIDQGALVSRVGNNAGVTALTSVTGGTTTTINTSGLTANRHVGSIAHVTNNASGAGQAPEGESSIVTANTATLVVVDPRMPFSAAIENGDGVSLIGSWNVELAADDDLSWVVFGVCMPMGGIASDNFGWFQSWGMCPGTVKTAAAIAAQAEVVADVGAVKQIVAGDDFRHVVGYAPVAASANLAPPRKCLIAMTLDFGVTSSDIDS